MIFLIYSSLRFGGYLLANSYPLPVVVADDSGFFLFFEFVFFPVEELCVFCLVDLIFFLAFFAHNPIFSLVTPSLWVWPVLSINALLRFLFQGVGHKPIVHGEVGSLRCFLFSHWS